MSKNQSGYGSFNQYYRQSNQGFQTGQPGAGAGFQEAQLTGMFPAGQMGAGFPTGQSGIPGAGFQQGFGFPQAPSMQQQTGFPGSVNPAQYIPGMLPLEQSYIENILRLNKGKLATVYMTFEGSTEWNSKVFKGIIEAAGRDHLILSDPQTGFRYLLPMVFFNYAVFEEELEYEYPFSGAPLTTYQPR